MTSPVPFDATASDEMFDRALGKVLNGDMAGLDEIDPDLYSIVLAMVDDARDAGWIGTDPGPLSADTRPFWRRWEPITSKIAAMLVVGLLAVIGMLAWRLIEYEPATQEEFSYASQEQATLAGGVCEREPRTTTEVADIVGNPDRAGADFGDGDHQSFSELQANLVQVTRNWNACLVRGQYDLAMAYESENYLRAMAAASNLYVDGASSDNQIATTVARQHERLVPMAHGDGIEIAVYSVNWTRGNSGTSAAEIWMVPVDPNGDWVEWPTVITFAYEDGAWVIELTDREGSPATPEPDPANR